jgi:HAD superfamily hydrolase (TIGR01549 family)
VSDLRALTFDVDGTLYDARRVRLRFLFGNLGRLRLVRVALRAREELRGREFDDGDALLDEHARLVAERTGIAQSDVRPQLEDLLGPRLCRALRAAGPRPGARAAIERAVDAGLLIGVVSDYPVDDKLEAMGLADLPWRARVSADALGALKPSTRCYERAAVELGVPTQSICHIGDRVDTDVRASRAAGLRAVFLGPAGPVLDEGVLAVPTLEAAVEAALGDA